MMKLGDFSSPAMRHFQNDVLKAISKYLKVNNDTNESESPKQF